MFNFGKSKLGKATPPKFSNPSAYVLFDRLPEWSGANVRARFLELFPDLGETWVFPSGDDEGSFAVASVGGVTAMAVALPMPVPGYNFEGEVTRSPWWPGARSAVEAHRANVFISVPGRDWGELDHEVRLENARTFCRILAALASIPGAIAVNWIESGSMFSAEHAVAAAQAALPVEFCVRTWTSERETRSGSFGLGAFSMGLKVFCGRELVMDAVSGQAAETIGAKSAGLARYLFERGPIFRHGDTIEFEPGQKILVTHEDMDGGPVYRVHTS